MSTAGWMPRASSRSSSRGRREPHSPPLQEPARGPGVALEPRLGQPHGQRDGDEPLLRAVVEVPFQPAALLVGDRHDARARRLELLQTLLELDAEALEPA